MTRFRSILLFVAVAAFVTVLGCGGGDDGETVPALSKAEFIKKADAICKKADEQQINEMARAEKEIPGDFNDRERQFEIVLQGALPPVEREAEQISELGIPTGDE